MSILSFLIGHAVKNKKYINIFTAHKKRVLLNNNSRQMYNKNFYCFHFGCKVNSVPGFNIQLWNWLLCKYLSCINQLNHFTHSFPRLNQLRCKSVFLYEFWNSVAYPIEAHWCKYIIDINIIKLIYSCDWWMEGRQYCDILDSRS